MEEIYLQLLHQLDFDEEQLDYTLLDKHITSLNVLSTLGSSTISVFDLYKKQHVFHSSNFGELLGYAFNDLTTYGEYFLDTKIHPTDKIELFRNGIAALKMFINLPKEDKYMYKLINEFRIKNANDEYVRLIEQHQILEIDTQGNPWLSLSIVDISPNQEDYQGIKSQFINFKTGQFIPFIPNDDSLKVELSKRELEILRLVKKGFLSKEISDQLAISIHTVNTHRQRFLEKLGANNSMEAVRFATRLGIIN